MDIRNSDILMNVILTITIFMCKGQNLFSRENLNKIEMQNLIKRFRIFKLNHLICAFLRKQFYILPE